MPIMQVGDRFTMPSREFSRWERVLSWLLPLRWYVPSGHVVEREYLVTSEVTSEVGIDSVSGDRGFARFYCLACREKFDVRFGAHNNPGITCPCGSGNIYWNGDHFWPEEDSTCDA